MSEGKMEYLIVFSKYRKIQTAFHNCFQEEKDEIVREFNDEGTFKGEYAASMAVYQLLDKADNSRR